MCVDISAFVEMPTRERVKQAWRAFKEAQRINRLCREERDRQKKWLLYEIKERLIKLAYKLAPEYVKRTVDTSNIKGYPLYMWIQDGKLLMGLHLC